MLVLGRKFGTGGCVLIGSTVKRALKDEKDLQDGTVTVWYSEDP